MDDVQANTAEVTKRRTGVVTRWLDLSAELAAADYRKAESWRYDLAAARQIMDEDAEEIARLKQLLARAEQADA